MYSRSAAFFVALFFSLYNLPVLNIIFELCVSKGESLIFLAVLDKQLVFGCMCARGREGGEQKKQQKLRKKT